MSWNLASKEMIVGGDFWRTNHLRGSHQRPGGLTVGKISLYWRIEYFYHLAVTHHAVAGKSSPLIGMVLSGEPPLMQTIQHAISRYVR